MSDRTDGLFESLSHTEPVNLDEPIHFCPVSDIHRDHDLHAESDWLSWLRYARKERRHALFFGLGDYNDFARAHVRSFLRSCSEGDNADEQLQKTAKANCDQVIDELKPLARRFIGICSGNHHYTFKHKSRGETVQQHSDRYIADALGCQYLGVMAHINLTLRDRKTGKQATVKLIAHHGVGGGATAAGGLNRVHRMLKGWNASVALMGDNHQRGIIPVGDELDVEQIQGRPTIVARQRYVARTGCFMRGFEIGRQSYVVDACYDPTSIGTVELEMRLTICQRTGRPIIKLRGIC